MFKLERDDNLFTLTMCNGENRFTLESIDAFHAQLDAVIEQAGDGPAGLAVLGEGKYWSNGIDLEALTKASPEDQAKFLPALNGLLGRIVVFPLPTIAALNGHAFAGGAILALAFDYRIMRTERGWFCLPEIDIGVPFPPGMVALLRSRLRPEVVRDAVLTARRYTGDEGLAAGIVDGTCDVEQLIAQCGEKLAPLMTKQRGAYKMFKKDLYGELAGALGYEA